MLSLLPLAVWPVVQTTSPEVRLANKQASCSGYGFKTGTDAYANCMMQIDIAEQQSDQAKRQAAADSLGRLGRSMQQQNRTVTCNSYGTGARSSTTTCY